MIRDQSSSASSGPRRHSWGDFRWEMRLYGLVRSGEREKAIRFLLESRGMSRKEAAKQVAEVAAELERK